MVPGVRSPGRQAKEIEMKTSNHRTRGRAAALVAAALALMLATVAATASAKTFRSGAGPGWPTILHSNDFVQGVDNPYYPLTPDSRYRYRGGEDGTRMVDRLRVTRRTKRILGVETTVVHDVVLVHGKPREVTNDFYAQDRAGNVWYFGENTKTLDRHGHVDSREGSFKAGRDGARPGVFMSTHAKLGDHARQEYYKGHALDRFRVIERNADVATPYADFHSAVRTRERTKLEPGVVDNKYYVRGIGTVRETTVKGGSEELRLVSFNEG
jgi:hypothetical protein